MNENQTRWTPSPYAQLDVAVRDLRRKLGWFTIATLVLAAAVCSITIARIMDILDPQPGPIMACTHVVEMPDAEVPGWYCVPPGQEG